MAHIHSHSTCEHNKLEHCNLCDLAFCTNCGKEWQSPTRINVPYIPPNFPPVWCSTVGTNTIVNNDTYKSVQNISDVPDQLKADETPNTNGN